MMRSFVNQRCVARVSRRSFSILLTWHDKGTSSANIVVSARRRCPLLKVRNGSSRWMSRSSSSTSSSASSSTSSPSDAKNEKEMTLIYTGGHGDVIRTLKRVSLTTCVIGVLSTPFFLTLGSANVPMAANATLTSIVLLATCGPTILLHAFTKPYIFKLKALMPREGGEKDGGKQQSQQPQDLGKLKLQAETMSFYTGKRITEFQVSDVKPLPNTTRPFVTFEALGNLYFVHGETFANKELLKRLVGRPLKQSELEPVEPPSWQ